MKTLMTYNANSIGRPDEITWHINDLLGTTLATVTNGVLQHHPKTTFGSPLKLPQTVSTSPIQPLDQSLPTPPQTDSIQRTTNP